MLLRYLWIFTAFALGFLMVGMPHWALAYAEVQLPMSLSKPGLAAVAVMAFMLVVSRVSSARVAGSAMVIAPATAVMMRVLVDTNSDPTSHNLWPFEIVLTLFAATLFVLPGVLLATFLRRRLA